MKQPYEVRIPLRDTLLSTINAAGAGIQVAIQAAGCKHALRSYGPRYETDASGRPVALLYRVDEAGYDTASVFNKPVHRIES